MLRSLFWASLHEWAIAGSRRNRPGSWRLRRWACRQQFGGARALGVGIIVSGPLAVRNAGQIEIGDGVLLESRWERPISISVANKYARLVIQDHAFINYGVDIGVACEVIIGAHSQIGNESVIYDSDWHSLDGMDSDVPVAPTRIGRGVWLGARVIVLKGVAIGDNTVVAANSTVTRDLPAGVLAAGTPARIIRTIDRRRYDRAA